MAPSGLDVETWRGLVLALIALVNALTAYLIVLTHRNGNGKGH